MPCRLLTALVLAVFLVLPAAAQDAVPPGVSHDAAEWYSGLLKRRPAGGSNQARVAALAKAEEAMKRNDAAAAVAALEDRISLGQPSPEDFVNLAIAYAGQTPPRNQQTLLAATEAYVLTRSAPIQQAITEKALSLMADALLGLNRDVQAFTVLEELVRLDGANTAYSARLANVRQIIGVQVRAIRIEVNSEPPRGCVAFTVPPSRKPDFHPEDWVRLQPAIPGAAITREGDEICISGLPAAATTNAIFRAGMPAEGNVLKTDLRAAITLPKRTPRIDFDTRMFVLPMGQTPATTLSTVNVSTVSLQLFRFTERSVPAFLRQAKFGESMDQWTARELSADNGSTVWTGHADIPGWEANKLIRTALPLPLVLRTSGPGVYAFMATSGDGGIGQPGSVQIVQQTDLAPTVWRGNDGLTIQVRGYSDARAKQGVRLDLLARNNDLLARATTDANGVAHFAAPLLRGQGPLAPVVVHAFGEHQDFAALDLTSASFDLSDRGVEGQPHPGPLDAYVWTDRGIYRPGETAHVMALLRDAAGGPVDLAAHVIIKKPNGQVFSDTAPARIGGASVHVPVTLSSTAAAGTWTVEVKAEPDGPAIGSAEFKVDSFVPDRLAVEPGIVPGRVVPGIPIDVPVTARFLYGAPAAHMPASATMRLVPDPAPFPALAGWHVGLIGEAYAPEDVTIDMPPTDGEGHTTLPLSIRRAPDTTVPLRASVDIAISDPAGRAAHGHVDVPVQAAGPLIGVRPQFQGDAVDNGAEAAFDVAAYAPNGTRTALKARYRLVRERPDWRMVGHGGIARYEVVWKDEPLETREIDIGTGDPLTLSSRVEWGRYRIEIAEVNGMSVTSYRFRAGWASESPDVPDRVDVSAARKVAPVGETVKVHIVPPFAGEATVLVLSDKVHSLTTLTVPETGADVDIPVSADWGPGAYVTVHVFRAGAPNGRPGRAIGLVWIATDPAERMLNVAFDAPVKSSPRQTTTVSVHTAPGAFVSVAAVDEGILRLTRFASPDASKHFLGRRRLGIDIRDDWGRLIAPPDGPLAVLQEGGDESGAMPRDDPDKTVSLFFPPVPADADGVARFPLPIGDFAGEVRLMAIAWQDRRIGAASQPMTVRDPVVAEALAPRYLAPGDTARVAILMHDLDLPAGTFGAKLTTTGPIEVTGQTSFMLALAPGGQALPASAVRATGNGEAVLRLEVSGPEGFQAVHDTKLVIRTARGATTSVTASEMAAGATEKLAPDAVPYLPGTWTATATFGGRLHYDSASLVQALDAYPFSCLEQATSRGFPLAFLPDGPVAGEDRAGRLQKAVNQVLDRQRYDGAFSLWRAGGDAHSWLTAYATEFLVRAKAAGAYVPDVALADALKNMSEFIASDETPDPSFLADQAYRLYVLALVGQGKAGAARILAEHPERLPTPLAKAQIAAALAMAHDTARAEALFKAAIDAPGRGNWWAADYGSALRDRLAITVLLIESGVLPERVGPLLATLPGGALKADELSTQEQARAVAAAAVAGRGLRPVSIEAGGAALTPASMVSLRLTGPVETRNTGPDAVWRAVSVRGVPVQAPPAASHIVEVQRRFFTNYGAVLDTARLKQNDTFIMVLDVKSSDDQDHSVSIVQGLPAGWEIAGRFGDGAIADLPWFGELAKLDAQPAADDRFAAVGQLGKDTPSMRVAVRLRAVSVGDFELPGTDVADMYRPGVFARLASGRAAVAAP